MSNTTCCRVKPRTGCRRGGSALGRLAVIFLLAGCARQAAPVAGPTLAPAPLPSFTVGDSFTFDDGRTEAVVAVSGQQVRWSDEDGFRYTTWRNILLPRTTWAGDGVAGQRQVREKPNALWPLAVGNRASFPAERRVRDPATGKYRTVAEFWSCTVDGTQHVAVKAGAFDTYRIACGLDEADGTVRIRTFYYAPSLGYYVRRDDRVANGPVQRIELASYRTLPPPLPPAARRARAERVQLALETQASGQSFAWSDDASGWSGEVTPLRTYQDDTGRFCRAYVETLLFDGRTFQDEETACRTPRGAWVNRKL